jgi:signal transduction histidine kinase
VEARRAQNLRRTVDPRLVDGLIAFGLAGLSLLALQGGAEDLGARQPLSVALLLLESLPLAARRRFPMAVLVITFGATLLHILLAPANVNEGLGSIVALYTVAERRDRRTSLIATLVVATLFAAVIVSLGGLPEGLQGLVQTILVVWLAWALGDLARTRGLYATAIEDRARLLEGERDEKAQRAITAERQRIARELHDIVAHHVSVIVIQAGAGLRALDRRPDQTRTAVEAIDRTGREALLDMRRMVAVLGDASAPSALAPMPRLDRLGELVEEVRAAGLPVELSVEGERRPLDAGIELSAYRIIQEALTNVLKHARGARARVRLRYAPRSLEIEIADEGGSGSTDIGDREHEGRGLLGMQERASLYGGRFEAGRTPDGFRVTASLPIDGEVAPVA